MTGRSTVRIPTNSAFTDPENNSQIVRETSLMCVNSSAVTQQQRGKKKQKNNSQERFISHRQSCEFSMKGVVEIREPSAELLLFHCNVHRIYNTIKAKQSEH